MSFNLRNPMSTLETLLKVKWNGTDAGVGTTSIAWGKKAAAFRERKAYHILFYDRPFDFEDIGRGSHADWTYLSTIEFRASNGTNFRKCVQEITRIIGENGTARNGSFDYMKITNYDDQSYANNNFYRILIDVELYEYGVSKS